MGRILHCFARAAGRTALSAFARAATVALAPALALSLAVALSSLPVSSVRAQEDVQTTARALFERGVERYANKEYEAALQDFQEAYRLKPHPMVRVNMANCYDQMKKPIEAIFHFERFLEEIGEGGKAKQRKEVKKALKRLRKKVAEIRLHIIPDGSTVQIDNAEQRQSPVVDSIRLIAGEHFVDVRHADYIATRRRINVSGGESREISITLKPIKETVAPVAASPAAAAGRPEPKPAASAAKEEEPVQDLVETLAAKPDERPEEMEEPFEEEEDIEDRDSFSKGTPALITGAVTAALAVATTVVGVMALAADADYDYYADNADFFDKQPEYYDYGTDAAARADDLALVTDILLGATVASAALTVYFLLTQDNQEASLQSRPVGPALGRTSSGIGVSGAF